MTKKTTATTTTENNSLMQLLIDDLSPSLDEALAAYEASGTTDDFNTWNEKFVSDYADSRISKRLENAETADTNPETAKAATPKKKAAKAAKPSNALTIPTVKAEIVPEIDSALVSSLFDEHKAAGNAYREQLANSKILLHQATDAIRIEVDAISKSFCKIGFNLWEVKENNLYEADGYKNISEYGEHVLGFKKSSTANYISICERFSLRIDGKPTAQLMDGFSNFSYGQLSVMLALPDDKVKDVTPDMSVKEVRALKKGDDESREDSKETVDCSPTDPPVSIFSRTLTQGNFDIAVKLLRENIGREIEIYVE